MDKPNNFIEFVRNAIAHTSEYFVEEKPVRNLKEKNLDPNSSYVKIYKKQPDGKKSKQLVFGFSDLCTLNNLNNNVQNEIQKGIKKRFDNFDWDNKTTRGTDEEPPYHLYTVDSRGDFRDYEEFNRS